MKAPFGRIGYAVAALVFAGYAIATLAGPRGYAAWRDKERQIQVLEKQNAELARQNEAERQRIDLVNGNAAEQEKVIQDRLKLVHPGEKVYVLPDQKK
jgi:cell division protein FtsB